MEDQIPLQCEKYEMGKSLTHYLYMVKGRNAGFEGLLYSVGKIWLYLLV